jgi:YidC/Oxa1 family membrane protein insertase
MMDNKTLLAVVLSIMVLVVWSVLFKPAPVPEQESPARKTDAVEIPSADRGPSQLPQVEHEEPLFVPETGGTDIVVETDLYRAVFSTRGAVIKSWRLKEYRDDAQEPVALLRKPGKNPPLAIILEGANSDFPQGLIYSVNRESLTLSGRGAAEGTLTFSYTGGGVTVRKKLVFYNELYKVDLTVEALNTPAFTLPVGTDFGVFDKDQREHKGPVMLIDSDRKEFKEKDSDQILAGNIKWIAQEDKYFTAAIVPKNIVDGATFWSEGGSMEIGVRLGPGKHDFILYGGPKDYDRLRELNLHLEHIIDFGWFSFVAMPLFWVLKFFYRFMGNYGWAIIVLTIIIRIPFIPILNKSQRSMKKMSSLGPMVNAIREKYKKDPQKMQKEITELYKKNKVNPIGGCLPMFLQIPVFIALYNVLLKAIELRGAPFVLWIHDLSVKDPYYILPVVMGLSMLIQQKMTPSTMDPKQAKIMMFMPIVFTFMFLTFPAGLVLYWLVNNILAIVQQYFVNRKAESA